MGAGCGHDGVRGERGKGRGVGGDLGSLLLNGAPFGTFESQEGYTIPVARLAIDVHLLFISCLEWVDRRTPEVLSLRGRHECGEVGCYRTEETKKVRVELFSMGVVD